MEHPGTLDRRQAGLHAPPYEPHDQHVAHVAYNECESVRSPFHHVVVVFVFVFVVVGGGSGALTWCVHPGGLVDPEWLGRTRRGAIA